MSDSKSSIDKEQVQHDLQAETSRATYAAPQDPKDDAQRHYATTPAKDANGSRDHTGPGMVVPQDPDPQATLARSNKGLSHPAVTRDPAAAERHLQDPDYPDAEPRGVADTGTLDALQPTVNLGFNAGGLANRTPAAAADQNAGYTPPSEQGPPHAGRQYEDIPPDAPESASVQDQVRRARDRGE